MVIAALQAQARRGDLEAFQALRAEEQIENLQRGPTHCLCGCGVALLRVRMGRTRLYLDRNHKRRAFDRGLVRDLSDVPNAREPVRPRRRDYCLAQDARCRGPITEGGYCDFHRKRVRAEILVDWDNFADLAAALREPLGHGGALRRTIDADWRANHKRRAKR